MKNPQRVPTINSTLRLLLFTRYVIVSAREATERSIGFEDDAKFHRIPEGQTDRVINFLKPFVPPSYIKPHHQPRFHLELSRTPESTDHFLLPFVLRLLDYRFEVPQFLEFHKRSTTSLSAYIDFLYKVSLIDEKDSFEHE